MIIQNQRQYKITKGWLARFEESLVANDARDPKLSPPEHRPRHAQTDA